jgi:hypothetical protein
MAPASEFYQAVGYNYERFSLEGYEHLVDRAKPLYESNRITEIQAARSDRMGCKLVPCIEAATDYD